MSAKLFLILRPDIAVFGEKDWQQLCIIRQMVKDLSFSIRVVGHPTIREPDGLAISSRNKYLASEERAVAPRIYSALRAAIERRRVRDIVRTGRRLIEEIPGASSIILSLLRPRPSSRRGISGARRGFRGGFSRQGAFD